MVRLAFWRVFNKGRRDCWIKSSGLNSPLVLSLQLLMRVRQIRRTSSTVVCASASANFSLCANLACASGKATTVKEASRRREQSLATISNPLPASCHSPNISPSELSHASYKFDARITGNASADSVEEVASTSKITHDDNPLTASSVNPFEVFGDFTSTGDFGSHGANLEYAVLSSMLQNSRFGATNPTSLSAEPLEQHDVGINTFPSINSGYGENSIQLEHPLHPMHDLGQLDYSFPTSFEIGENPGSSEPLMNGSQHHSSMPSYDPPLHQNCGISAQDGNSHQEAPIKNTIEDTWTSRLQSPSYSSLTRPQPQLNTQQGKPLVSSAGVMRIEDVYRKVIKPYVRQRPFLFARSC